MVRDSAKNIDIILENEEVVYCENGLNGYGCWHLPTKIHKFVCMRETARAVLFISYVNVNVNTFVLCSGCVYQDAETCLIHKWLSPSLNGLPFCLPFSLFCLVFAS